MSKFAVIFPAGGRSARFSGKEKKPFTNLDGRAVWLRCVEIFVTRNDVCQCIIVVAPDDQEYFRSRFGPNLAFMSVQIANGGAERCGELDLLRERTDQLGAGVGQDLADLGHADLDLDRKSVV